MAEKKRGKKKKTAKRALLERRFLPEQTHASPISAGVGMVGAAVLGAGVYGQWIAEDPARFAPALVATGALALGGALWLSSTGTFPVRVGDIGIAIERGSETSRVRWCDLERIVVERGTLTARSPNLTLSIALGTQPAAVSRIIAEAEKRRPEILKVADGDRQKLPPVKETDAPEVPVEGLQIAGARCAVSDTLISFERDARLCPNCGEVYHREHVPKQCASCKGELTGHALSV